MHLDADNRPVLNYRGYVTQNTNGVWSVLCDDRIDFDIKGAEYAGFVCINLGLKGYRAFNKTELHTSRLDVSRQIRQSYKHIRDELEMDEMRSRKMEHQHGQSNQKTILFQSDWQEYEPIVGTGHDMCRALYVECVPFSTGQPVEQIDTEDKTKILDFHPQIHPAKKPVVVVEPPVERFESPVYIRFPWIAEIYVNGQMKGCGILLEHYWVLTTSLALDSIE